MSLQNAKILYEHLIKIGRVMEAEDVLRGYPELKKPIATPSEKVQPKAIKKVSK